MEQRYGEHWLDGTSESLDETWRAIRFKDKGNKPQEVVVGSVKLQIAKDSDTGEIAVRWIEGGRFNMDKSYFTNDVTDAINTMSDMARRLLAQQQTSPAPTPPMNPGMPNV